MPERQCAACLQFKSLAEFNRHVRGPDGYTRRCRECLRGSRAPRPEAQLRQEARYRESHRDRTRATQNEFTRRVRLEVLRHYGGDPPRCACCGETAIEFLALDHIHGGGRKHRQSVRINMTYWLWKNHYPEGFRVLCHNCNMALGRYGYCPHGCLTASQDSAQDALTPTPEERPCS